MNALELLIVCCTVVGCLSIICYTIAYIGTNETILRTIKKTFEDWR